MTNSLLSIVASYLVNAIWQVPLLTGAGWLASRGLKRLGPAAEHKVWVGVLLASVMLPGLAMAPAISAAGFRHKEQGGSMSMRFVSERPTSGVHSDSFFVPAPVIDVLAACYLGCLLFFVLRFAGSLRLMFRLTNGASELRCEAKVLSLWEECKRTFGVPAARLLTSEGVAGPAATWVQGPLLLVPRWFLEEPATEESLAAFAHECAHLMRDDALKNLLYEGASLLTAFHPLSWFIKARIAETREMICDELAIEMFVERRVYVQSLLRLASLIGETAHGQTNNAIGIFDANILEKRIMTLIAAKRPTSAACRYSLSFAAALCLFLAASGGVSAAVRLTDDKQEPPTTTPVYTIGKDVSSPKIVYQPEPLYPENLRKSRGTFNGTCLVGLVVDAAGKPREVHVVRSLSKDFDENAVKAVQQYRFAPAEHLGKPVPVALSVEVRFQKF